MTRSTASELAQQIRVRSAVRGIDHLKLQKLCFYAYGAALGLGVSGLGDLQFEAWKHGPVNRDVWDEYKGYKGDPLPVLASAPTVYDVALRELLDDVVEVYGRLSSWAIRCETHLERPWLNASREKRTVITNDEVRDHFARKFAPGSVMLPVHMGASQNGAVDSVPPARFKSLHDMASALRAASSPHPSTAASF